MKVEKILVPVDFSECSKTVIGYAVDLGQRYGAVVSLLHVVELPLHVVPADMMISNPTGSLETLDDFARAQGMKQLTALTQSLGSLGDSVEPRLAMGSARDQILAVAEDDGFDLIVMGTHGRTGLSRFVLGSVAEQVVRRAKVPVLTVRAE